MNRDIEELLKTYDDLEESYKLLHEQNRKLKVEVDLLNDNRKYLNNVIDKAIEYIHNNQLVFELSSKEQIQEWFDKFYVELLNILRGEDNE